jgi:hypothetical protein
MASVVISFRARFGLGLLGVALVWAPGCKKDKPAGNEADAADSAQAPPPPPPPRCAEITPGANFTIGKRSADPDSDPDDDADQPALPFAVEIGGAVPTEDGFAVSALSAKGKGTTALVALVARDAGSGRIVELGQTHGDVDPPRLAARGGRLYAGVPDSDAGGGTLRLAQITTGATPGVTWGPTFSEGRDESRVFGIELGKKRGILAWDELDKKHARSGIRVATFSLGDLRATTKPRTITTEDDDAEAPHVVDRPGGFWLAWIDHPKSEAAAKKGSDKPAPAASATDMEDPLVELGQRVLMLAPLDENGALAGAPKAVTGNGAHVLVFDLAAGPDGSARLSWRDDDTSPGVEGRTVHLARVSSGGAVQQTVIEDDAIGAGVPSLLEDAAPEPGSPRSWLGLTGVTDATRMGVVGSDGTIADRLDAEPAIRSAELLSLRGGRLLVAHSRGLAVELSVVRCKQGPAAAK